MNYIDMILDLKQKMFQTDLSGFTSLACAVGCIAASFAIIALYNKMMNDPWGMFDLKEVIRIIVTLLLVCNFYSIVLAPFDGLTSILTKGITMSVKADSGSVQAKLRNAYISVEDAVKGNTLKGEFEDMVDGSASGASVEDSGLSYDSSPVLESQAEVSAEGGGKKKNIFQKIWGWCKGAMQDAMGVPFTAVSNVLSWILSCAVDFARFILLLFSGIYLIILGVIGPFVFALSIIPDFSGGVSVWIARYIQIAFWMPVCSIVDYVNIHLKDSLLDVFANTSAIDRMVLPTVFVAMLDVVTLLMLFAVPSISSWVVSSAGASDANGSIVSNVMKAKKLFK